MHDPKNLVSHEKLTQILNYDPDTGEFRWMKRRGVLAGAIANHIGRYGYIMICIDKVNYAAHRLAWFYIKKEWPKVEIDHRNRNKLDNRIDNLRLSDRKGNTRNAERKIGKTGLRGVVERDGKFRARLVVSGKVKYFGTYDTAEAAHQAYVTGSLKFHGDFSYYHK